MQVPELAFEACLVVLPRQPIYARRGILLEFVKRLFEQVDTDVMECGELLLLPFLCDFPYESSVCDTLTRLCARLLRARPERQRDHRAAKQ
jgi:hypothetical protein